MYRKILIVVISVFLSTVSVEIQGLVAFLTLAISYYVQSAYKPYVVEKLNKLE